MKLASKNLLFAGCSLMLLAGTIGYPYWHSHPNLELPANVARPLFNFELSSESLGVLPEIPVGDQQMISLGKLLFHDSKLSADGTVSCASCHLFSHGGSDPRSHSFGVGGKSSEVNAPSVFNAAFNFVQFWDGRAATLEEQSLIPLQNPAEMNTTLGELTSKLQNSDVYRERFSQTFGSAPTPEYFARAISAYERTLITPDSRFDKYIQGEKNAINEEEIHGYELFKSYGCVACHQGSGIGGNMFQRFGVMGDYFGDRGNVTKADYGRFNVTGKESDRYVFKVPSLRNVELTPPYFHDGSAVSLEHAVITMGKYQLGRDLLPSEIVSIVAFLHTLTGRQPDA